MKNKMIISAMLAGSLSIATAAPTAGGATAGASANTGAGVNTATTAGATVNTGSATATSENNAIVNAPGNAGAGASGMEQRGQLPRELQTQQENSRPGLGQSTTPNVAGTNQFVFNTNQSGNGYSNRFGFITNQFSGGSNGFRAMINDSNNLTPTGRSNWMNRYNATNQYATSNQFSLTTDQAVTVNDRTLLVQIKQSLEATISAGGSALPVHFRVDNGVVTVVGMVPTTAEAQQIYSVVQRTPGVTRVVSGLQIGNAAAPVVNGQAAVTTTETVRPGPASSYSGSGSYYYDNNPANFGSNLPPTSVPPATPRIYVVPSPVP